MNPVIYVATQERYREAIKALFCCKIGGVDNERSSIRDRPLYMRGDSKFYSRQLSTADEPNDLPLIEQNTIKNIYVPNGRKLERQISFQ